MTRLFHVEHPPARAASKTYMTGSEGVLQDEILGWLASALPGPAWIENRHGSPESRRGVPDIEVIVFGRSAFIECKAQCQGADPQQRLVMRRLKNAGSVVGVAWRLDDAYNIVEALASGRVGAIIGPIEPGGEEHVG
mgnify:CR=1 FL=1